MKTVDARVFMIALGWSMGFTVGLGGCYTGLEPAAVNDDISEGSGGVDTPSGTDTDGDDDGSDSETLEPAPPGMRRLTPSQYRNVIADLFGADVPTPDALEAVPKVNGSEEIGAAWALIQTKAAKELDRAAYTIAAELFANHDRRDAMGVCTPVDAADPCIREFFEVFVERAWRRPPTATEIDELVQLVEILHADLENIDRAFEFSVAAILQSPHFLYRPDWGEPDGDGARLRYTSLEMASRLSFALWGSIPDQALYEAGKHGDLLSRDAVIAQAKRMLMSPRVDAMVVPYLMANLEVDQLENMQKDTSLLPHWTPSLALAAMRESREMLSALVQPGADFRNIFRPGQTWVNPELAEFYGVTIPDDVAEDEFVSTGLGADSGRVGLLGTVAWLSRHAGSDIPSPMGRGHAIRRIFMCQPIVFPENLDELMEQEMEHTDEAEQDALDNGVTLARAEAAGRLASPICRSCHAAMDPIGLALENFDASGTFRAEEHGTAIDPSGDVDGVEFSGLSGLASLFADSQTPMNCIAKNLYAHLAGHPVSQGEALQVDRVQEVFADTGYSVRDLIVAVVASDGFRYASPHD